MKSLAYLLLLIALVFGGGYLVIQQRTGEAEPPEIGGLAVAGVPLTVLSATPTDAEGGRRLDVTLAAADEAAILEVVPAMFEICTELSARAEFAPRLAGITELQLAFTHPGAEEPLFPTTLPLADGVCQ